ncbi:MAG: class I SAM-dependent methyltransferase, partial [Gammaproteobacteria bacterium]
MKSHPAPSTHSARRPRFLARRLGKLLAGSGVEINGPNPWDPQIHNDAFYKRVLLGGSLGLGESYAEEWWDCAQLDEMYHRMLRSPRIQNRTFIAYLAPRLFSLAANLQSKARSFQVGEAHYDIGNDLYRAMLDARMVYTCGYWADAGNLEDAQEHKLELVCRKLDLQPGMRVLDIGCGWGSFAKYAAEKRGVEVTGVTVSKAQVELGNQLCAGLPVELRLQDYRDVHEQFDSIVSLGMFEHVGRKNHRAYMRVAHRCLKPGGKFLLHTIGKNHSRFGV